MNSRIQAYRRVASRYKWDYQTAELALADSLKELTRLSRLCSRLSTELNGLLQVDGQSTPVISIIPEHSESLFLLATALKDKLVGYRRAHQQQASRVVDLRKQLLQARTRRDKSRDRYLAAIGELRERVQQKESDEMADLFVGRKYGRAPTTGRNYPVEERAL